MVWRQWHRAFPAKLLDAALFAAAKSEKGPETNTVTPPPSPNIAEGKIPPPARHHRRTPTATVSRSAKAQQRLQLKPGANRLNGDFDPCAVPLPGRQAVWADFRLSYSEGLSARNFVRVVWLFCRNRPERASRGSHGCSTITHSISTSAATGALLLEHVCLPPDKVNDLLCTRSAALCHGEASPPRRHGRSSSETDRIAAVPKTSALCRFCCKSRSACSVASDAAPTDRLFVQITAIRGTAFLTTVLRGIIFGA